MAASYAHFRALPHRRDRSSRIAATSARAGAATVILSDPTSQSEIPTEHASSKIDRTADLSPSSGALGSATGRPTCSTRRRWFGSTRATPTARAWTALDDAITDIRDAGR
jgi:hypothetical protein